MPRETIIDGNIRADVPIPEDQREKPTDPSVPIPATRGEKYDPEKVYPEGTLITQQPSLFLNWKRETYEEAGDGWAQVGIEMDLDDLRSLVTWHERDQEGKVNPRVQFFIDFKSRYEANKLVREARRARDAAFGADA